MKFIRKTGAKYAFYDPVGYCIYCGDDSSPTNLTDEHIIPLALNGDRILPNASCPNCQRIINDQFENHVLRKMFGVARSQLRLETRNKRKREWKTSVELYTPAGRMPAKMHVDKVPILMWEPEFLPPGILLGTAKQDEGAGARVRGFQIFGGNMDKAHRNKVASQTVEGSPPCFARFLAKIAHGYMVAEHHNDIQEYLLPSIILGKDRGLTYLVGNEDIKLEPLTAGSGIHMIKLDLRDNLAVVLIRLFINFGKSLTYSVVAARMN